MEKKKKEGHGTLENLLYWLKTLYRDSPLYIWLNTGKIGLTIGISLLGVYMPSVLVADITEGKSLEKVLTDLAVLGGGLVWLYLLNNWLEKTELVMVEGIGREWGLRIAKESLDTDYARIERADFPEDFWQMLRRHMYSSEYNMDFLKAFTGFTSAVIGMVLYVGMLSGLSLWILLLVIGGTAVSCLTKIYCNKWEAANRHKWIQLDNKTDYLSWGTSSYEAAKDVHLYRMSPWLLKLYNRELKQRLGYTLRQQANYFLDNSVSGFTNMIWQGASYFYLVYQVCEGRLDAAGFVLYFGIITGFAGWCESIVSGMRQLHQEALYVEEQRRFFDRLKKESGTDKAELVIEEGHIPEIIFDHVSFQYEGAEEPTIKNLNLTLRPGENIALVGLNGAGKTTFIKLLCGFYEPTEGHILIDGVERSRYSIDSWLRYFSGVFQDAAFFPMSLRENLVLGEPTSEEELKECLKMADLEERIDKLPKGLDSLYGWGDFEDAVDFSGGELQKLMLARALGKQAPILVLDEPTAALDPLMESELYESYSRFSEGKTTIFISHRLASTRFCDRILLLESGAVVEAGTHEELMEKDGRYAWMFRLQSRYYQDEEAKKKAGLV